MYEKQWDKARKRLNIKNEVSALTEKIPSKCSTTRNTIEALRTTLNAVSLRLAVLHIVERIHQHLSSSYKSISFESIVGQRGSVLIGQLETSRKNYYSIKNISKVDKVSAIVQYFLQAQTSSRRSVRFYQRLFSHNFKMSILIPFSVLLVYPFYRNVRKYRLVSEAIWMHRTNFPNLSMVFRLQLNCFDVRWQIVVPHDVLRYFVPLQLKFHESGWQVAQRNRSLEVIAPKAGSFHRGRQGGQIKSSKILVKVQQGHDKFPRELPRVHRGELMGQCDHQLLQRRWKLVYSKLSRRRIR